MTHVVRRRHTPRDAVAQSDALQREIVAGFAHVPYSLPCKLFYDENGAQLFEAITRTEAYYPTRAETAILRTHAADIAVWIGPHARIVELGSGSGAKSRILLDALSDPELYVPIDVSREQLLLYTAALRATTPTLRVDPLCLDYTLPFELPPAPDRAKRTVVFFPGSTIGNFQPLEALRFLRRLERISGPDGALLIGVDLRKDAAILDRAYNDPDGFTARFNLNILTHVNRLTGADFDPATFEHRAFYNEPQGRVEMHLVSRIDQLVHLPRAHQPPLQVPFTRGDAILTEYSYKYHPAEFVDLATRAGYRPVRYWVDPEGLFSVHLLVGS